MKDEKHIGLGAFLITIGILWLLSNLGLLQWNIINSLIVLWPLIIVAAGLNLIFRKHALLRVLTWILLLAIFLVHGFYTADKNKLSDDAQNLSIERSAATEAVELKIELGGLDLAIGPGSNNLLDAKTDISNLNMTSSNTNNKKARVNLKRNGIWFSNNSNHNLDLRLNSDLLWDLNINTGAINGSFDLKDIKLQSLDISMGAAKVDMWFGTLVKHIDVKINAGASSFDIYVPKSSGIRIDMDGAINSTNFLKVGLTKIGNDYFSENYELAENKIDIEINMGVGKVNLIYE